MQFEEKPNYRYLKDLLNKIYTRTTSNELDLNLDANYDWDLDINNLQIKDDKENDKNDKKDHDKKDNK